jgi:UDP-2,3-diacylglucosamine hydrolase
MRIEDRGSKVKEVERAGEARFSILYPLSSILDAPIGLLAGSGRFPIVFAEKARSLGIPVVCVGLRHEADPNLAKLVQRFYWVGVAQLGRIIHRFRRAGVRRVVMAGKVKKAAFMHRPWRVLSLLPDWRMIQFWYKRSRRDNRDDSVLLDLIGEFAADGLSCESALDLCPELLVKPGILTQRKPNPREERDIAFGWDLAKEMGRLDVGQSVAVKEKAVLAVEAIEGTDQAIARAGELCRAGGFVVVKVAKPQQDMRFDVPTVGCTTIETMHQAKAHVLAIEAGKTILLDERDTITLADRYGITIVALPLAA